MVVAHFTRFVRESPELFRLIPGRLRRRAVFFANPRSCSVCSRPSTAFVGTRTVCWGCRPGGTWSLFMESTFRQRTSYAGTRDVLKRTLRGRTSSNVSAATRQDPGVLFSTAISRTQAYTVRDRRCMAPATFRSASPPPASPVRFDRRSTGPVAESRRARPPVSEAEADGRRGDLIEYSRSL
jgi:hypothetical protein